LSEERILSEARIMSEERIMSAGATVFPFSHREKVARSAG